MSDVVLVCEMESPRHHLDSQGRIEEAAEVISDLAVRVPSVVNN